uniref:SIS domain-containing protein n=1 Tax=Pyxicephalus adspersus TaxID=30357 RepID=A0AAV3A352_PYXAD|nr:TPA: hypothetical protein GDO54_009797 [Pyxicephalus adspersus]
MRGSRRYNHVIETPEPGKWELAGYEESLPISEKSNPITREIDKADPNQMVQLLRDCDAEIFQEEDEAITNYQNPNDSLIVLSGCGTSGRLALLLANSFNNLLQGLHQVPCYTYIMAAGDRSMVVAQEAPEDNPLLGAQELERVCAGKKKVIYFGISCSLSIEGWTSTFRQVAERLQSLHDTQKGFVLNPAVGPEGICGSSRMKGGSATKILLETLFLVAHKASANVEVTEKCVLEILRTYERAHKVTYAHSKKIATLLKQSATSLQKKGHLYILGWGTLGTMAIMDAAECVPTFHADWKDVRGFINGGYESIKNKEGDLTPLGAEFAISHEDFVKGVLPSVSEMDTVLLLFTMDDKVSDVEKLVELVKEKTSNIYAVSHATAGQYLPDSTKKVIPNIISITWPILFLEYEGAFIQKFQRELSTKWILNTVTSGAYVLKGQIHRSFPVDFRISNTKHFYRAISILQSVTGQSQTRCTEALLQSIHGEQILSDQTKNMETSRHVEVASTKDKVLPVAIVSLLRNCSVQEARTRLDSSVTIRAIIEASLNVPGRKRGAESAEKAGRSR